jgi:predicted glycoside hydrolase/deacetylase ChbG (UPF0249 family)
MRAHPSPPSGLDAVSRPGARVSRAGACAAAALLAFAALPARDEEPAIEVLVRADDLGAAKGINDASIACYREGIARSVEVIVPGPWFLDAARLLAENPGLDAGVHLTLTSEWEGCKWRPLTHAPSLVDRDGYFRPMTRQRQGFPPDTGFLDAKPSLAEVEAELRAQIEMARRHIPRVSHLSAHMGAATATPELRELTRKLAAEYQLLLEGPGLRPARGFTGKSAREREESLVQLFDKLEPGRWLLVEHPGFDGAEMRGLGHEGYRDVAADRDGVTAAFRSARVKEVIARRRIRLISYADLKAREGAPARSGE